MEKRKVQRNPAKGVVLAMIATVSWASLCVVGRYLFGTEDENCSALSISAFRNLIGAAVITGVLCHHGQIRQLLPALKQDWKAFAVLALIGTVLESTLQIWSLKYTTAARCSLFANTAPIYTLIIAHFALHEPFTRRNISGMVLGFAGILLIARAEGADMFASGRMLCGDLLALASGICWAVFTVYSVRLTQKYGSGISAALLTLLAALLMLPFCRVSAAQITWPLVLGIGYMGLFTAGIANLCWLAALKHLSAGATGAFGYASFGLAVLFSVIFLDEKLTLPVLCAFLLVLFGVSLMVSGGTRKKNGRK